MLEYQMTCDRRVLEEECTGSRKEERFLTSGTQTKTCYIIQH